MMFERLFVNDDVPDDYEPAIMREYKIAQRAFAELFAVIAKNMRLDKIVGWLNNILSKRR